MGIYDRLPLPLSERLASATSAIYSRQGREVDVAIGGIPFRLATFSELPQSVETIPLRKDQFDAENDPGEQTLTGWWRRSQASWHEGAGNLYQESSDQNIASAGFYDSSGIDVFTQGRMTLLKAMKAASITAATTYTRARVFTGGGVSAVGNGALHTSVDADGTYASLHAPGGKTIIDGFVSSATFYDVATDGTLYEGLVSAPGAATSWPLTGGSGAPARIGWGKHRLWALGGRSLWQPDLSLAGGTNQPAIFTNPNKGWTYTCMAEGMQAMYFGGHDGMTSSIQAVTLDSGGAIPTLTGAAITAVLPDGELVQEISVLAGSLIGIGTNRGFRVGTINSNSTLTYGPLLIEPAGVTACTALTTQGRFFVVAFNTTAEGAVAYRVDTGSQITEGVYPYAKDISCGAGYLTSLTGVSATQLVATASSGAVYYQSPTEYVSTGYLQTGRIRYRTTEPKDFRWLQFGIEPLAGAVQVDIIKEEGSTLPLGSITQQGLTFEDKFTISAGKQKHVSLKFTLTPNGALTGAPIINNYLLRALPAVTPQRLITLPLLCYEHEEARSGQRYGGAGFAQDRLSALQILEDNAEALVFQDFSQSGEGRLVVIESVKFTQTSPSPASRTNGAGGVIVIQLRTVDA